MAVFPQYASLEVRFGLEVSTNISVVRKHSCRCFRIQPPGSGSHANAIWRCPARRLHPILYPGSIYENSAYPYYGFHDYRLTCWYSNGICSTFRAKVVTPRRILDHNYLCCHYPTAAQPHHIERGRIYKEINCVGHAFCCILRGEYCRTAVLFHWSGSEVLCKLCSLVAQDALFLTDVMQKGIRATLAGYGLATFFTFALFLYYIFENKRRDVKYGLPATVSESMSESEEQELEVSNKTDRELTDFRYILWCFNRSIVASRLCMLYVISQLWYSQVSTGRFLPRRYNFFFQDYCISFGPYECAADQKKKKKAWRHVTRTSRVLFRAYMIGDN